MIPIKPSSRYYLFKFLVDGLVCFIVFLVLSLGRFGSMSSIPLVVWVFGMAFPLIFWTLSYLRRDYMPKIPRDALNSFLSTIYTFLISYLFSILTIVFLVPNHPSRLVLGLFFVLGLPAVSICRYCFNRYLSKRIIHEPHRILFAGAGKVGLDTADEVRKLYDDQIEIIGFLDDERKDFDYEHLGKLDDLETVCERVNPDSLFISISNINESNMIELVNRAREQGLPVKVISDIFDIVAQKITGGSQEKFPVIEIQDTPVRKTQYVIKRSFDVIVSSLLLLFLSPIFLIISILIKLESYGSIFYIQERAHGDERIEFLKFRTMYKNADKMKKDLQNKNEMDGPIFKIKKDPRVTNVGKWLRRFSLDELPQLINVLRGEMSLIGPRPLPLDEVYEHKGWHKRRLQGKPGVTGLWQVSGRNNLDFEDMCLLDIYYLENWSLWLDFKILLKTIPAVLTGRGAY